MNNNGLIKSIKYLVLDVDGTMTDAGIYYDETGNELKKFCTRDAAGFRAARQVGIKIIVLTGRECRATTRRMNEMRVDYLFQGIKEKTLFLQDFLQKNCISKQEIGYVGDDINDLSSMLLVGFVACPNDACEEVKKISNYVSCRKGGEGVIRDVVEYILKERNEWDQMVKTIYLAGI